MSDLAYIYIGFPGAYLNRHASYADAIRSLGRDLAVLAGGGSSPFLKQLVLSNIRRMRAAAVPSGVGIAGATVHQLELLTCELSVILSLMHQDLRYSGAFERFCQDIDLEGLIGGGAIASGEGDRATDAAARLFALLACAANALLLSRRQQDVRASLSVDAILSRLKELERTYGFIAPGVAMLRAQNLLEEDKADEAVAELEELHGVAGVSMDRRSGNSSSGSQARPTFTAAKSRRLWPLTKRVWPRPMAMATSRALSPSCLTAPMV